MAKSKINKEADEVQEQVIDYREVGATGLKRFSGFIYEEFRPELTGAKAVQTYKEMADNDPTVGAMLFAVKMLIRRVPWRTEAASETPEDTEAAEFLEQCMDDMSQPWVETIDEIMSMLEYGYSVQEIVYKRRCGNVMDPTMRSKFADGRIGWRKLSVRSQDTIYRWQFDDNGGLQGVEQLSPPHYYLVTIPVEKFLLFRTTSRKNNPEGRSCLRNAYRPWFFKKNLEQIEAIGAERDLAGIPVAKVPPELLSPSANPQQKALLREIQTLVTNIRNDEQAGVVFPNLYDANGKPLYELSLMNTGGTRQFDTDKIINRYDKRIAMTLLADFILLGQEQVGSFALASNKTNIFATAIGAFLDIVTDTFNRYAIPRLFALNDFTMSDYPKIKHGDLESVDLKELGDYITKLAGAGMPLFPNQELEKYLMEAAHMPVPPEQEMDEDQQIQLNQPEKHPTVRQVYDGDDPAAAQSASTTDRTPAEGGPKPNTVTTNIQGNTEMSERNNANNPQQLNSGKTRGIFEQ